ncbi:MAG: protein kinase domain-containing protein [Gemmatimonadales bacterium]
MSTPDETAGLSSALGGQYRFVRELGRGGMGVVFLAHDVALDRPVAIKVVHPDLSSNRTVAARFLSEARAIAKLRHPNIVAVHAAGEIDGQLYFVMDFLAGETLRQRLQRDGKLPPEIAVKIATEISGALDAASAAGIVHRDLKPENILLEGPADDPRALLADFGIARLIETGSGHTGPGAVMGTPAYMSPEQAAGEDLDGRSDLYSLGVVTYEMLTGSPPFVGPHRTVISKQILDQPTPITQRVGDVSPAVAHAVMQSLEKVPTARWPNGAAFRHALRGDTPPAVSGRNRLPARRRIKAAAWAVSVVAAIALLWLGVRRPGGPPAGVNPRLSLLVLPFDNLRDDAGYGWLREGSVNMLALSLSQWQDLTVIDQDRVHDLVAQLDDPDGPIGLDQARRLARQSRAWTVVLGDFSRAGDSIHLTARRYDVATGKRLDIVEVNGAATDDVRPLFDQLAAHLLDLTGAPAANRATLASVTTTSVEAYRDFLRGVEALNHWRLTEASTALEAAVRRDPAFSLANYKLAVTRGWISPVDTLGMTAIRRATLSSERLPARERQLIDGYRSFIDGDYDRGIDLYAQLIAKDSTDVEAWYGWADAQFHWGYTRSQPGLLNNSLQGFRRVIGLDSTFGLAYEHVGALLTDASQRHGWFRLVGGDSLASVDGLTADSGATRADHRRAQLQAVELARSWTRLQPNTPRAHYHLYKALLAGGRVAEARQVVGQLRALFPDSVQPFFGFLDARAQFVGGDIEGSARTVRSVLPSIRPRSFRELDFAPEPMFELMTGVDALGYLGDVQGAADIIRLGRRMFDERAEQRDPAEKRRADELWEISRLGQLFGATGTRPDRLRDVWDRGLAIVREGTQKERLNASEVIGSSAVGLLLGPAGDASPLRELDRLTQKQSPRVVQALLAARGGDSVQARALLEQVLTWKKDTAVAKTEWHYPGDHRPIMAETYFELGDYAQVVATLADFEPSDFATRGFDARWVILPRVRLLRGQALEQLGKIADAAEEYRAVVAQWSGGDAELRPVVQEAQRGLARVAGVGEGG